MGVALGWMALALGTVAGAPDAGRGGVPIKYTVRVVEAEGLEWRQGVMTRMTPVTRQGAATVWTAPRTVEAALRGSSKVTSTSMNFANVVAWTGTPVHIRTRSDHEIISQAAWNGEGGQVATRPERLGVGSVATMTGRKLDQGILVQMVLKDTKVVAVHRVAMDGPAPKSMMKPASTDPATKPAAYHVAPCEAMPNCHEDDGTSAAIGEPAPIHPNFPWSELADKPACDAEIRPAAANVNQKRPLGKRAAKKAIRKMKKRGVEVTVVAESSDEPAPEAEAAAPSCSSSCCEEKAAPKVAIEVPEIDSQEIAGEWLIPNDGILLVSFGPHTVADSAGKAVIRERLAIISAEESTTPPPLHAGNPVTVESSYLINSVTGTPSHSPSPAAPKWTVRAMPVPLPATPPAAETKPAPDAVPLPAPVVPPSAHLAAPMPPVPSRSIPQGFHADGKVADLPPLPADGDEDDADDDASSEARPSPQARKPRSNTEEPQVVPKAKSRPSGDTAARKAQFSVDDIPGIPAVFRSVPTVGLQFLLPIKPVSLKLPFDQRLEIVVYGRVVTRPEPKRTSSELASKSRKDGATKTTK
ncbi:MAG: hypothetical protein ACYC61_12330 [Isosphaeraceae bacterium]